MLKAIKTLAIVSAFALVISSFSACSLPFGNDDPTTTESTTTERQTDATVAETTASQATTTTEAAESTDTIKDIFADIKDFPFGTAGSSVKAASLALRLIAFSNSDLAESDTLDDEIKSLVATVEDGDAYSEALYQINSYAKKFFDGSQKTVVELAGSNDFSLDKEYSQEKYQKIYEMLAK